MMDPACLYTTVMGTSCITGAHPAAELVEMDQLSQRYGCYDPHFLLAN